LEQEEETVKVKAREKQIVRWEYIVREMSVETADKVLLLEDFLNRCDLIKFARYEATSADSRLLLEEATRFVKGEQFALA